MSKEDVSYWEKNWNLPLVDEVLLSTYKSDWVGRSPKNADLVRGLLDLVENNPDRAFEIAEQALKTEGLLDNMDFFSVFMCKAASYDDKVVDLVLKSLEANPDRHVNMFRPYHSILEYDAPALYCELLQGQLDKGNIEPARLFKILKQQSPFARDPQYNEYLKGSNKRRDTVRDDENKELSVQEAMGDCVVKDQSLWNELSAHVKATERMNGFLRSDGCLTGVCVELAREHTVLSKEICDYIVDVARRDVYREEILQPALVVAAENDMSYFYQNRELYRNYAMQQVALKDHSIIPDLEGISRENFGAFAKIYEDYASKGLARDGTELLGKKNVVLDNDETVEKSMENIKDKILHGYCSCDVEVRRSTQVWLVKNAQEFPNFVKACLESEHLPAVEMCIKNIEDPKREDIGSLLQRLETPWDISWKDFQEAREFAVRRDMCRRVCLKFNKDNSANVNEFSLSYDMAQVGIDNKKTAKRVVELFSQLNKRPDRYRSPYNEFYPEELKIMAEMKGMQDWMYPVMLKAIGNGGMGALDGRFPSERTLFDCCKAWKICPEMPQRLAERVGKHSLYGRMLAGAVFDQMSEKGKTDPSEWKENKNLHEKFFEELSRAEKMDRDKALKQYIPNTAVNRKRLVGAGMEEKGIENTPDNFKTLYRQMREKGIFDKMLAKPGEAKTTFNSRLLVEVARRKQAKSK